MLEVLQVPFVGTHVNGFFSFTLAIILLFVGKLVGERFSVLRRYSIPEPVLGGFLCAAVVGAVYFATGWQITFEMGVREFLLLYFFAGIGLKSDVRMLLAGGKPLLILLVLSCIFIVVQNMVGMGVATLFDLPAVVGLMTGSISLVGGIGTTLAWAPHFIEVLGISHALEIGMASNVVGMIAACVIGGPIASYLLRRHRLPTPHALTQGQDLHKQVDDDPVEYFGVLRAWLYLNLALILGAFIGTLIKMTGLNLPDFVSSLTAGILIRNIGMPLVSRSGWARKGQWESIRGGLTVISDICLGMFLTMALMGIQLWVLQGVMGFVTVALLVQIVLAIVFTIVVVFRCMGRDYESAVVSAGFGGIALGSTATAVANMTAVTSSYGAAQRAFVVVPLVCGFFIDIVNAIVISLLAV